MGINKAKIWKICFQRANKPKEDHSHLGILISLLLMYLHLCIPKTSFYV